MGLHLVWNDAGSGNEFRNKPETKSRSGAPALERNAQEAPASSENTGGRSLRSSVFRGRSLGTKAGKPDVLHLDRDKTMTNHRWLTGIGNLFIGNRNRQGKLRRRKQAQHQRGIVTAEILETKVLLAADTLGLIQGTVFNDVSDNGLTGEDPLLTGATVQLYKDGGNLSFDNGAADDTLVGSMNTIAGGKFAFENLAAGRYFVRQQAIVGYMQHAGDNVVTIDISPVDALGTPGTLIDDFTSPVGGQTLSANASGIATSNSFSPSATSIGGERDMSITATSGSVTFEANGAAFPTNLNYNANFGATGNDQVVWDGADGNPTSPEV